MSPDKVKHIVDALEPWAFSSTHGAFDGMEVMGTNVKGRIRESARIAVAAMGWDLMAVFGPDT